MRNWTYGINNYHKTASIYLEIASWHIFVIRRVSEFMCDIFPAIQLPDIKFRLRDRDNIEANEGEWTTFKEWHGDMQQLFHIYIHMPIFEFCDDRIETKYIEIDYDKCKELFYKEKDKAFWDGGEE